MSRILVAARAAMVGLLVLASIQGQPPQAATSAERIAEAEELVQDEIAARSEVNQTTPHTTAHSDKNIEGEPGG